MENNLIAIKNIRLWLEIKQHKQQNKQSSVQIGLFSKVLVRWKFRYFQTKIFEKNCGIRTGIVGVQGECSDHSTTTTAHYVLFTSSSLLLMILGVIAGDGEIETGSDEMGWPKTGSDVIRWMGLGDLSGRRLCGSSEATNLKNAIIFSYDNLCTFYTIFCLFTFFLSNWQFFTQTNAKYSGREAGNGPCKKANVTSIGIRIHDLFRTLCWSYAPTTAKANHTNSGWKYFFTFSSVKTSWSGRRQEARRRRRRRVVRLDAAVVVEPVVVVDAVADVVVVDDVLTLGGLGSIL